MAIPTQMTGEYSAFEQNFAHDNQSNIMNALNVAQTSSLNNINEFMRQSIKSLDASERQSLNESAIANAITDYYINGQQPMTNRVNQSMDSRQLKQITEEMIVEKINRIFEDARNDNQEFEDSYHGFKKSSSRIQMDTSM